MSWTLDEFKELMEKEDKKAVVEASICSENKNEVFKVRIIDKTNIDKLLDELHKMDIDTRISGCLGGVFRFRIPSYTVCSTELRSFEKYGEILSIVFDDGLKESEVRFKFNEEKD